ncbi:MAG: ABC transporter permease [Acidimicrobiia bacterium]|nr:MAG: ABC transporter permease [Acidimicrobiia bacterium]
MATAAARLRAGAGAPPALAVAAVVTGAAFAAPLAYLCWYVLGLGSGFVELLRAEDVAGPLRRTLALATSVSASAAVVGTLLAWLAVRTDLPGRRVLRVVAPLPLVVPSFVGAFALVAMFAPGGLAESVLGIDRLPVIEGFWAAWAVLTLLTYPYVYLPVAARLAALPPSLEESARALGRRPAAVFRTIVLPQTSGAMSAGALLVFLYCLSEFGAVKQLRYDTLTTAIYSARVDRDVGLSLSLVLAAAALAVAAAERRVARRRVLTEAVAPAATTLRVALGRWRLPAVVFTVGVVGTALVVPVVVLAHWTVRGLLGDAELHAPDLIRPAATSAALGAAAAAAAVAAVLPLAFLTTRYRSASGEAATAMVVTGFALPGLVLALALVYLVLESPLADALYQTYGLLVFAYVVHFGTQALGAAQVAVGGVPARLDEAARALGAGRARRLATVQLPLMRPGLLAGAGLVLLSTMKELPATLILAPPGTETLATRIWGATEDGFFALAGSAALVLLAVSAVLTYVLTIGPAAGSRS